MKKQTLVTMTKKTMVVLAISIGCMSAKGQTTTDFETFTLSPNSAYSPTTSTPFQTSNAVFEYEYDNSFDYWSGGFSYTNTKDSSTAGYTNLYGVKAYNGFNNSNTYVVGQDEGTIKTTTAQPVVNGFYITNTTYAYKTIKSGDSFTRKFGDTTGTGSGTTIAQGSYPDYFKVTIKGYKNGLVKNDSVTVFLANYTFTNNTQDFVLNSWQFVNTSVIGAVDSIQFFMGSSDVGEFGINTPLFFAIDNLTTSAALTTGIVKQSVNLNMNVFPNPFNTSLTLQLASDNISKISITDITGKNIYTVQPKEKEITIDLSTLTSGIYFLEVTQGDQKTVKKIVKN